MNEGYKKTDVGYIPNEWEYGRIDDYFDIQQGKSVSKANRIGNNQKPFLRTSNLLWGKVTLDELDYLHFTAEEEKRFKLEYNDLLVCEGGDIGRTGIWRDELQGCYYQNHLHRLRRRVGDVDPVFVLYWMQYAFLYGKVYFGRANITTIPNLSKSRLSEFTIPKPPLPEQQRISTILGKIQKAIEQQDKLIRTTTELKKALMQKLFTGGIGWLSGAETRQKQTEIGLVPEGWDVLAFPELFNIIKSQSHSRNQLTIEQTKTEILNVHYGDIHSTFKNPIVNLNSTNLPFIKDEFNNEQRNEYLKDGDIIIADASEDLIDIGKCVELKNVRDKQVIGGLHTIVARPKTDLIAKGYGAYIFKNKYVADEIRYIATGMSVYGLSKGNLLKLKIPIPTLSEQQQIAEILDKMLAKIESHQNKKQALEDLFKTMLHELMTGQRRVHEIDFKTTEKEYQIQEHPLRMAAEKSHDFNY